ncbi:MAG: ThuA domain-containing protein [Bacteroidota bacterium]
MKKNLSLVFLFLAIAGLISCKQTPNVLLVLGGHSYDTTEFFDMFHSLEGIEFDTISHPHAPNLLQSNQVEAYDLLLFYDFIPDMPLKDSSIYIQITEKGIPLLFLHHAIGTFQKWDGYKEMVGGRYVMPGFAADSSLHSDYNHDIEMEVKVISQNHPVTQGISNFTIHDEGYSNLALLEGVTPLLTTDHPDCSSLVGWTHTFNSSETVYLIFGHDKHAYENASFRNLLLNAINWLVVQE